MPIRVFLADDHAVVRDGLRFLLEVEGDISVVGDASNGRQTVQQVMELHPDVVIMDIAMPDLNGIEATKQVSQNCPEVLVIILSVYATSEHIFRALQAGAQGYLLKESAGKEVVKAVRAVYSGRRYLSRKIEDTLIEDYVLQRQASSKSPLERLSAREREVLQLVVEGNSSAVIAEILNLSVKSVETYRSRLMQKLGINDLPGLVKFAIQHGLTPLETGPPAQK
ncbi:response regulator [Desulforhabdus amnigena]|jgi:DNA-binding NarL/FixJ family response regulator|uniref:DNA-binding response regulator n=1 Tax=Desulforhabdus amnigena TaxID=40218 RepID=A0A9W6D4V4_9BACT|nr:response regulator transcription factor [Desulforhabdus amnigena]NLJ29773.1 response regulator transcription factor [Deltaproteobacteria bacterium]GLI33236.1 DNA-binding response regulator [Desulforhabdus amnigena]